MPDRADMQQFVGAYNRWNSSLASVVEVERQWREYPRRRIVEAHVDKMLEGIPHDTILDLGCGTAQYAMLIPDWKGYVGLDESEYMLKLAGERLASIERTWMLAQDSILDHRFGTKEDPFDLCLCLEVSPHYSDPLGLLDFVLSNYRARYFLLSVEAHERSDTVECDFLVPPGVMGSRSLPLSEVKAFFARYPTLKLEKSPEDWHPDAQDWFALVKGED